MRPSNYIYCTVNSLKIWSAICFKIMTRYTCGFFPTYTCNHSCYTIYVRFFATYICVLFCFVELLFLSITISLQTRIYAHKKAHIYMRYKQACVYGGLVGVPESSRIRGTEIYRKQKPLHVRRS